MKKYFLFIFCFVSVFDSAYAFRTVSEWESLFIQSWQTEYNKYIPLSKSGDSWHLYVLSYAVDANVAMFEATTDSKYLDRALLYVNNFMATAKKSSSFPSSQFGDIYLTWINHSHPVKKNDGKEYALFESYCWRYVARMLRVMRNDSVIYNQENYRVQYKKILSFTEKHIFEKWYNRGRETYIYRSRVHMVVHWAYIALELSMISENHQWVSKYKQVTEDINLCLSKYNSSLRKQIIKHPNEESAYFWNSTWNSYRTPGQDVSHGNNVVSYVVESYALGSEWTLDDMLKFCRTFTLFVWPKNKVYARFVDGSGVGNGWFSDGFCKLGRFNKTIQERLELHEIGRSTQFLGNGALNAKILTESEKL